MKQKTLLLLLILFVCRDSGAYGNANKEWFTIDTIQNEDYAFPLISSDTHPKVAVRINQTIQMFILERLYKKGQKENIFDQMKDDEGIGVVELKYTILSNTPAILSIQYEQSVQLMRINHFVSYLNFNAATGELIDLRELLSPEGFTHFDMEAGDTFHKTITEFYGEIQEYVESMKKEGDRSNFDQNAITDMKDTFFNLARCNASHRIANFGVSSEGVLVVKNICLGEAHQSYDLDWSKWIKTEDFIPSDFTPLGKTLLVNKEPYPKPSYTMDAQVISIHGKIDSKYPFSMILSLYDQYVEANYWYDKIGKRIFCKAKKIYPNQIEVDEGDAKFIFDIQLDGTISGRWIKTNGDTFPITFQ
ncbi:hypothetical protein OAT16_09885 [Prolixibacteraceae bacterium]|nr:hypothetical protein [Prolixibacteraceae bacterium]